MHHRLTHRIHKSHNTIYIGNPNLELAPKQNLTHGSNITTCFCSLIIIIITMELNNNNNTPSYEGFRGRGGVGGLTCTSGHFPRFRRFRGSMNDY